MVSLHKSEIQSGASMIRNEPYWWDAAPPTMLPRVSVPGKCDVAIVGAG